MKASAKQWREDNLEQSDTSKKEWANRNRDHVNEQAKEWREQNQEKVIEGGKKRRNKRRARKLKSRHEETISLEERLDMQGGKCANCKRTSGKIKALKISKNRPYKWTMDHIIPLFLGGADANDNIEILCWQCNATKNAKSPEDWELENGRLPLSYGSK